jgi:hypothetical protein
VFHEIAQDTAAGKPQHCMNMIRHHHEPETSTFMSRKLTCQVAYYDPLGLIMIQQTPPVETRKRDKVCMALFVVDSA